MSILKVGRIGHPIIRRKARTVEPAMIRSRDFQKLIDDMVETMHEYDGVGVAGPQVHVGYRIAVLQVPERDGRGGRKGVPLTVLINPTVTPASEKKVFDIEGCLSVPELRGLVPRFEKVRLEALDRHGKPFSVVASGFHARVIQHECDHLDGHVYLDRMDGMKSLGFLEEMSRFA